MTLEVRAATPADIPDILRLIRALAAFEREPDAVEATEASLTQALFGAGSHVHGHVAARDGRIAGIAIWFLNFSTWTGRPGLYVEDVFVEEAERGRGMGRALFGAMARQALARGCARMDWAVLDWNAEAMRFYERVGARRSAGWQPWRLERAGIEKLALTPDR